MRSVLGTLPKTFLYLLIEIIVRENVLHAPLIKIARYDPRIAV